MNGHCSFTATRSPTRVTPRLMACTSQRGGRGREKGKREGERGNALKFLAYSPSGSYVPPIPYACASAYACAIHGPAKKTYELSSRLMEYARARTMDPRERTASPFNYLASYSISEARTRRRAGRTGRESESDKRGSDLHRFLLLKAPFFIRYFISRV